jgi:N-acetyl-alpha-D-muramate 1-phosphate uridylyltransferase
MILAAGFGTRMGALTAECPKPLIPVAGRALMDHALDQARTGSERIVVNGHYRAGQMRAYLAGMADVIFVEETPLILDSGGGIRAALPILGGPEIFTLNTDAVWTGARALAQLDAAWDADRMDALLLMVPQARAVGREAGGDFAIGADGRLAWDKAGAVHTGAQILKTALFEGLPEGPFSLYEIWNAALARGRLFGVVHQGHWADVGHAAGIALAEDMLRNNPDV